MKIRYIVLIVVVTGLFGGSCAPMLDPAMRAPAGELPGTFSLYEPEPVAGGNWWVAFDDRELDGLIGTALSNNFGIKRAWARLRQANAAAVRSGSFLYPDLTVDGDAAVRRQRTDSGAVVDLQNTDTYALALVSSYELDLWGGIRSQADAARLEATATREDVNAAAISVAAEVAIRYYRIISARMQQLLLEKQLDNNRTILELVELRFRNGLVSALDVFQQKQVVENVLARIPLAENEEKLLENELMLLLGRPPGTDPGVRRTRLPEPGDIPAAGVPADLLANRPDIRSAGLKLRASGYRVAEARANRLPAIALGARAGIGTANLDLLFDNWLVQLAAALTAPVFDADRRKAEVDRTRAAVDENLWSYRQAVFTAIKEVEDALITETKQRQYISALEQQIQTAKNALEEAGERYRKGLNEYLPVLTQLLSVQNLEIELIQRKTDLVVNRIRLHRALGGSWPEELRDDKK
jgi:NodT family efflux transporter outer membrane factor (OMF) lipoprotein